MSSIYLQLQNSTHSETIYPEGSILFDSIPQIQSSNIQYLFSNGVIALQTPGIYLVNWSVAVTATTPVQIGLVTSSTASQTQKVSMGDTLGVPGQVSGSAIIEVTAGAMVTLQLVNKSSQALILSNVPVMANLTVYSYIPESASGGSRPLLTIPFSSAGGVGCYPGLDINGNLTKASIIGCSQSSDIPVRFDVSGGTIIQVPYATDRSQFLFSFPYNVRLVAASAIFNNHYAITLSLPTTIISPYVSIATQAIPDTYTFDIIEDSRLYPTPGYQAVGTTLIPNTTILTAKRTDFNVPIAAGTPFAIIGGLISIGLSTQALNEYIFMNGTMVFEIDE